MSSALKWALTTAVGWGAVMVALGFAPSGSVTVVVLLVLGGLGFPVAGGAIAGAKALRDRRLGIRTSQARAAIFISVALVTLGLGLLLALTSARH